MVQKDSWVDDAKHLLVLQGKIPVETQKKY